MFDFSDQVEQQADRESVVPVVPDAGIYENVILGKVKFEESQNQNLPMIQFVFKQKNNNSWKEFYTHVEFTPSGTEEQKERAAARVLHIFKKAFGDKLGSEVKNLKGSSMSEQARLYDEFIQENKDKRKIMRAKLLSSVYQGQAKQPKFAYIPFLENDESSKPLTLSQKEKDGIKEYNQYQNVKHDDVTAGGEDDEVDPF